MQVALLTIICQGKESRLCSVESCEMNLRLELSLPTKCHFSDDQVLPFDGNLFPGHEGFESLYHILLWHQGDCYPWITEVADVRHVGGLHHTRLSRIDASRQSKH